MSTARPTSRRYDAQATVYDRRTALDAAAARSIAAAILAIVGDRRTVVEIGAGTGELGRRLAARSGRYFGLDLSRPMLARFRAKLGAGAAGVHLMQAECNGPWPLRSGAADVVIAVRVVHLLAPAVLAAEARRVCRPGGVLLIGRVRHDEHGLRERLRRERRRLFAERGVGLPGAEAGSRRVLARCTAAGATPLGKHTLAAWTHAVSAAEVIAGWDAAGAWAGGPVAEGTRAAVQAVLRAWARAEFGTLQYQEPCRECFLLDGVRFP
ncbi:MAG TPA: class I SAM-dependent methyltransferase [Dehalococcoidia bacterium]|nr:class I SAM-dependent methyltransferase [Dehalococcoidia bacterium]